MVTTGFQISFFGLLIFPFLYLDPLQVWCAHYGSLVEFYGGKMSFEKALELQVRRFSIKRVWKKEHEHYWKDQKQCVR